MDLSRIERSLGPDAVKVLREASVCVFGLGGVGSYAAESLARSGIGRLTLVDFDTVAPSNMNRQLVALESTLGRRKVDVMAERIADINPDCRIRLRPERYMPGDFDTFMFAELEAGLDGIIDAIDDVPAKVDLLAACVQGGVPVVSVMGTGNKLAPEQLTVSDISRSERCPLARRVRKRLRAQGIRGGVTVVFSTEAPRQVADGAIPGSLAFVPGAAGLMAASVIVRGVLANAGVI